jgi:hypothetical protein
VPWSTPDTLVPVTTAVKVAIWAAVFVACAAAGALVAAHTDPFPPGVEDPGARPSVDVGGSLEPAALQTWRGSVVSETSHRFHVGGACRTTWRGSLELTVDAARIGGDGTLELHGGADCDFPVAQVQAESISVAVSGVADEDALRLRLTERGRDPVGSHDLGGLVNTLRTMRPVLRMASSDPLAARDRVTVKVSDGDQGAYASTSTFAVSCADGC